MLAVHGPGREILRFLGKTIYRADIEIRVRESVSESNEITNFAGTRSDPCCARNIIISDVLPKTGSCTPKLPPYYRLSSSWAGPETMIHGATSVRIVAFGERGHTGGA